jgi:hypothetical protein
MNVGAMGNKRGAEPTEACMPGWHALNAAFGELTPAEAEHFQEQTLAAWAADSPALADWAAEHLSATP